MATFRHNGAIGGFGTVHIGGMTRRGYPKDFAERCFQQIRDSPPTAFPRAMRRVSPCWSIRLGRMKCHHPDVFLAAILNAQPMGFYQPAQLVRDARAHGLKCAMSA